MTAPPAYPSRSAVEAGRTADLWTVLRVSLEAAVPLEIANVRCWSDRERLHAAKSAADVIGSKGDVLQYGGKGCAAAFAALARGLAIGAYMPGGITFAGLHWCAAGCDCPSAHAQDRAIHTDRCGHPGPDTPPDEPHPRRTVTIDVAGGRL